MWYILFGILAGNALPLQTSVNAGMRKQLRNPLLASLVSFLVTILTLSSVVLVTEGRFYLPFGDLRREPFWIWLPGFLGIFFMVGNILLFPKLGGVKTIICTATGQVFMALLVDSFGLFRASVRPISAARALGGALALAGVVIVTLSKSEGGGERLGPSELLWCAAGVFTGMTNATQTTINAYAGAMLGSAIKAADLSAMESLPLVAVLLLLLRRRLPVLPGRLRQAKPWMWLGGICGAIFLVSNAWLSRKIGTGLAVVSILIGSTFGGLLIDQFGLFDADRKPVTRMKALGMAVMLAGAALIRLA